MTTTSEALQPNSAGEQAGSTLVVADVASLSAADAEAEIVAELDRLQRLSTQAPLGALDQVLVLMQGINVEILKCKAPALIESAHLHAANFATQGRLPETQRADGRELASLLRLQEGITKLGVARVKVHDELARRAMWQSC
jgi:hypothetical protein